MSLDRKPSSLPPATLPVSVWLTLTAAAGISGYLAGHQRPSALPEATLRSSPASLQPVSTLLNDGAPLIHHAALNINANSIADIAAQAGKSVVHIEVAAKPHIDKSKCPYFFGPDARLSPDGPMPQGRYGSAAGVIIRNDGYILTNAHVVRGADEIKITLADGREFMAKNIGRDTTTDLAVVKIDAAELPAAHFGDSTKARPGEWAIAIGSPFHLSHSVSLGIISALDRTIGEPFSGLELIQTDAAINPGSSGGPLLNLEGEVIGINCVVRSDAQNIAFAVPARVAREVSEALLQHKKVQHNYIGVKMNELSPTSLSDMSPKVLITYAHPSGPAWRSGVRNMDKVKSINGKTVKTMYDLKHAINTTAHGGTVTLTIIRDGKEQTLNIGVENMPESFLPKRPE